MKSIMEARKDEEREAFLKLSPLERMKTMHQALMDVIELRAKGEGVSAYEIYRRYLRDNKRHYQQTAG